MRAFSALLVAVLQSLLVFGLLSWSDVSYGFVFVLPTTTCCPPSASSSSSSSSSSSLRFLEEGSEYCWRWPHREGGRRGRQRRPRRAGGSTTAAQQKRHTAESSPIGEIIVDVPEMGAGTTDDDDEDNQEEDDDTQLLYQDEYDENEEPIDLLEEPTLEYPFVSSPIIISSNQTTFVLPDDLRSRLSENFATNVSYFYLRDELGLSDEAMWRVTYQASSVLGMKTAVIKEKVQVLQDTMDLSGADLRALLSLHPSILHLSADRNVAPTILFLVRSLDLGKADLRHLVLRCPAVLGYSRANLRAKLAFFRRLMGYSIDETRALFLKEPRILRASVRDGLIPHWRYFVAHVQLSPTDLRRIVMKNPKLLLYSIERNLYPKLNILNMTTDQTHRVLLSFPQYCDYNLDRTIAPALKYLVDDLGLTADEVRAILARWPRIVSYTSALKSQVGFFRYEMGLSPTTVKMALRRIPSLVGLATDTIRSKLLYYSRRLDYTDDQVKTMIASMPQLLVLDVDGNVEAKIAYLSERAVHVGNVVQKLPAVLAYSLDRRITPRVQVLQRLGLSLDKYLPMVLQKTETNFAHWVTTQEQKKVNIAVTARPETGTAADENMPTTIIKGKVAGARVTHWTR